MSGFTVSYELEDDDMSGYVSIDDDTNDYFNINDDISNYVNIDDDISDYVHTDDDMGDYVQMIPWGEYTSGFSTVNTERANSFFLLPNL